MTKTPSLNYNKIISGLQRLGFVVVRQNASEALALAEIFIL